MAVAHYLEALDWQREFIKMHAVLGGKNPHLQSFLVGGMATPVDPDSQAALNAGTIAQLKSFIAKARDFVARVYIPDLLAIAVVLQGLGRARPRRRQLHGLTASIPRTTRATPPLFLPQGIIRGRDLSKIEPFDPDQDHRVHHPFLVPTTSRATTTPLHPFKGETRPTTPGRNPPYERLDTDSEVFVAEVAALRRRADGSRAAGAHARRLRVRACRA